MSKLREHLLDWPTNLRRAEGAVRAYLLSHSHTVSLSAYRWKDVDRAGRERLCGGPGDARFHEVLERLAPWLISVTADEDGRGDRYLYHLSPEFKETLNRGGLIWGSWAWGDLYGFEDPEFHACRAGTPQRIGAVVSHEYMFYLYLEDSDFDRLRRETGEEWSY